MAKVLKKPFRLEAKTFEEFKLLNVILDVIADKAIETTDTDIMLACMPLLEQVIVYIDDYLSDEPSCTWFKQIERRGDKTDGEQLSWLNPRVIN